MNINSIILFSSLPFSLIGMEPGSSSDPKAIVKAISRNAGVQNSPLLDRNRLRYSRDELQFLSEPRTRQDKKLRDDFIESIKPALTCRMNEELEKARSTK